MTFHSRDQYQLKCVDHLVSIAGRQKTALVVLPTSAGKTHVFCKLIGAMIENSFLIIVPRITLVEQTRERIKEILKIDASIFCASLGEKNIGKVTIASAQSCHKIKHNFDYVIYDECHGQTERVEKLFSPVTWFGFTATPFKKNASIVGSFYQKIDYQIGIKELIQNKFITTYHLAAPDSKFDTDNLSRSGTDFTASELALLINRNKVSEQLTDMLERVKPFNKIAIMAVNISHAHEIAANLPTCSIVHSKQRKEENDQQVLAFEKGANRFLVSVTKLAEGYDYDGIDCIVLMRPTRSITLMIQMIGRGLRLKDGKHFCQVLDYGDVIKNCGTPATPMLQGKDVALNARVCRQCKAINKLNAPHCYKCKFEFVKGERKQIDYLRKINLKPFKFDDSQRIFANSATIHWGNVSKNGNSIPKMILRSAERSWFIWLMMNKMGDVQKLIGDFDLDRKRKVTKTYAVKSIPIKIIKNNGFFDFKVINEF